MLNVGQLRERVAAAHPDAVQVAESVVRFVRTARDSPFAVCYLDLTERLPDTRESLTRYQDDVIGAHYFNGPKSLQWSNYLYFVTTAARLDSAELRHAKELIESDRSYARKFVISEDELDTVLAPPAIETVSVDQRPDILSIWTERLVEAGLDKAILYDDDLPKRIAKIESSSAPGERARAQTPRSTKKGARLPFLRRLDLIKYRKFPLQRAFDFGRVNLIFGANASGKTSLLEAIELFYCGRNRRTPEKRPEYDLVAALANGHEEQATSSRKQKVFRERNLAWYGRPEIKTNNLYQSFAQFNFLDTDAAVRIADATETIEEDLSKLLVGPDAAKVWRNMERVRDEVATRLSYQRKLDTQIREELDSIAERLQAAAHTKKKSDAIATRLADLLGRSGWRLPAADDRKGAVAGLVASISELISLTEQSLEADWVEAPVSLSGLIESSVNIQAIIQKSERALKDLEVLSGNRARLKRSARNAGTALDLANEAKRIIDARIPERSDDIAKFRDSLAHAQGLLAGFDPESVRGMSPVEDSVVLCLEQARSKREKVEQALERTRKEYVGFAALREQTLNLTQKLRQIAGEILQHSAEPDECPLCHTRFGPGELEAHMALGIDDHAEALGQRLLATIKSEEAALAAVSADEMTLYRLSEFCQRCRLPEGLSVAEALAHLRNIEQTQSNAQERFEALNDEAAALASEGLSITRFKEITEALGQLGHVLPNSTSEGVETLISELNESLASTRETLRQEAKSIEKNEEELQNFFRISDPDVQKCRTALSHLKEELTTTKALAEKLKGLAETLPWPPALAFTELTVTAKAIRSAASELQLAQSREAQDETTQAETLKRRDHLTSQAAGLTPRLERLAAADRTLHDLMQEHSLNASMKNALRQNRSAIESIFGRIHSPPEFSGLGEAFDTLIRKGDRTVAKLSQVSTGQRAALALSIFLAQNSQVVAGPSVMLIDDPVAHVDDLNSLSFLDYLRETVIRGERQIFFATANDKFASLFERKFDFLENEFRRLDLSRQQMPGT